VQKIELSDGFSAAIDQTASTCESRISTNGNSV
jgi:hypothetical protein